MGFNRGGNGGGGFGGGNGGKKFEPQPGSGTLFVKNDKRDQKSPDYDGYFIADRVIQPGEKIKLVGWDKPGLSGHKINLKIGREPQNAPGYNNGAQQGGYQPQQGGQYGQPPQGSYNPAPGQYGGPPNNPTYGQGPQQGRYQAPAQPQAGAYQGGGYGGTPARTQPLVGQAQAPQPPAQAPAGPNYPQPPADDDLPF